MVEESDLVGSECKPKRLNEFDRNSLQDTLGLLGRESSILARSFRGQAWR
jgi:hypothetical protein